MSKEKNLKKEFLEALIKAQSEIGAIYKDKINPHFKNKYVPLNSILAEIKPVLNANNFFLTQKITNEGEQEILKTEITHINGECLSSSAPLNVAEKNNPQKYGSAITYMRRYSLNSLLGLEEEDDDGQKASQSRSQPIIKKVSNAQLKEIQDLIDKTDKSASDICGAYKISSLPELLESQFKAVVTRLKDMAKSNENS